MQTSSPLRIITVGDVDHGKSTLLGRLLYDTDSLSQEQLSALHAASEAEGKRLEMAFVLDSFLEEQTENITIDMTHIPFRTSKRSYVMMDAPGHREFLKNMLTGASSADAAILLVSVVDGLQEQTRRHVQLLSLLGMNQVIVVINKLDLVSFSEEAFQQVSRMVQELFQELRLPQPSIIPTAAFFGENVACSSSGMPWYQGKTVLQAIDLLTPPASLKKAPLRFVVQDIYHFQETPLVVGRIESGSLHIGEELLFWPQEEHPRRSRLRSIEEWNVSSSQVMATAGQSIAITLADPIPIKRGDIASTLSNPPLQCQDLDVRLFWLESTSLSIDYEMIVQLGTQRVLARVSSIKNVVDATNIEVSKASALHLSQHEVADVGFHLHAPLACDYYEELPATGCITVTRAAASWKCLGGAGIIQPCMLKK